MTVCLYVEYTCMQHFIRRALILRFIIVIIYLYGLIEVPLRVCMENTAQGACQETNTAQGIADCCIRDGWMIITIPLDNNQLGGYRPAKVVIIQ